MSAHVPSSTLEVSFRILTAYSCTHARADEGMVRALLEARASVNHRNIKGSSPLVAAAMRGTYPSHADSAANRQHDKLIRIGY